MAQTQTQARTTHAADCRRVFARLDPACPRCQELAQGLPARRGWGTARRENDARRMAEIRTHDCARSGCGPVCTRFDW